MLALVLIAATVKAEPETPPNILLIVAEDMSGRVSSFGDSVARTPAIDALAAQGIRYPNVFTASGVCAPSRSALITGVYPTSMGTHQMRTRSLKGLKGPGFSYDAVPPGYVKAFPEILRRAGYVTGNLAKLDYQFGEPFTVWDLNEGDFVSPPDLALWRKLPKGKPFFVMLNLMSTHESRLFPSDKGAVPPPFGPMLKQLAAEQAKNVTPVTDPASVDVPPYYPDTPEVRASIAQHYDNIHYMDGEVARILANLDADGLKDNTIVIWTTDHGDGLPRAKRSVYDSGIKVPLIIRYPDGRDKGMVREDLVSFVDLAPAILGLAGIKAPDFIQGRDFLSGARRDYIYAGRDRMDNVPDRVRAVRDQRFKYIRNYMTDKAYFRPLLFRDLFPIMKTLWSGNKVGTLSREQAFYFTVPRPHEELYDTQVDPHEIHNLAADPAMTAILARMREALDGWIARVADRGTLDETEMVAQMWPDLKQPLTAAPEAQFANGLLTLESATEGASIGYRINKGTWQLYTAPVPLRSAERLEAKAIRYGYAESAVMTLKASGQTP